MKKKNLVATLAIIAIPAITLMAHQLSNYNIDKNSIEQIQTIVKADAQAENVKADMEAIKNLNEIHNIFLDTTKSHYLRSFHELGKAVMKIKNPTIQNAYQNIVNSIYYHVSVGKELSLWEMYLSFNDESPAPYGLEFIAKSTPQPIETINKNAIIDLNKEHSKFINFIKNSANLQKLPNEMVAQNIIIALDDLGKAVNDLDEGEFKDLYIQTLNTIGYYFAYNNEVYILEDLFQFAKQNVKSVYWDGLKGIKVLLNAK